MVTQKEYKASPENTQFRYKPTGVIQPKAIIRFKMNQIGEAYCRGTSYPNVLLLPHELKLHLHGLLGEALEEFEIVEQKLAPKEMQPKSEDLSICHKCGLERSDCVIIEEGTKVMRICGDCRK